MNAAVEGRVEGACRADFTAVRDAFAANLRSGADLGASVCVTIDGETVVDLWGGHLDEARTTPWRRDTLVNVYSTSKTMMGAAALMLADRGELSLDAPVARYWPEFAAVGKADVRVRHLLGHTSGLPGWDAPIGETDLCDWEKVTTLLAAQAPWWEPGTASGYHAVTQGFLVGEVVRRVAGQSAGTFFAHEVAGPLGADFHIGLPPERDADLTPLIPPPAVPGDTAQGMGLRVFRNPYERAEWSRTEAWRRAEVPACNGMGNARSIARVQSLIACGGVHDGRRLISEAGCGAALTLEADGGTDLVVNRPVWFGRGYKVIPGRRILQGGGWGGSAVVVDLEARMVVAYAMNRMLLKADSDARLQPLIDAAYGSAAGLGAVHPDAVGGNVH